MAAPQVSVVIPVRDGARVIGRCLDGLARQVDAPPFEVIVVDNDSTDATMRLATDHPIGARVVREPVAGSYSARNAGIRLALGDILAFTDADCTPEPGWIAAGVAALTRGDLAGGRIATDGDSSTPVARYDRALYLDQQDFVDRQGFAATANLFVTRATVRDVGPFDATLRSGGDLEFCRRAAAGGHALVFAGDAVVRHDPRTSYRELWRLHRRLGAGWADLARRGLRPSFWRDPALRWPTLEMVVAKVNAESPPLRRRQLAPVHYTAMAARWMGRLTGR